MSTSARTTSQDGSHWYTKDGQPAYEVPYADQSKGFRPTTLKDARKLGLLPSVTTILKILHKQALVDWLIEQAVLAVITTPRIDFETDDAFVHRVLHSERVQDQESQAARDRGMVIHGAIEAILKEEPVDDDLLGLVSPAVVAIREYAGTYDVEKVVVGLGYAGKLDLQISNEKTIWLWDWKTTKKLPEKDAWPEHRLQLSAYAAAIDDGVREIKTGNVYISTVEPGKFSLLEHKEPWMETYQQGFKPLVTHWQWSTGHKP